jgi:hypothetical protein
MAPTKRNRSRKENLENETWNNKRRCDTYRDLLQDGLKKDVVLGKIAKNLVILGEIDEDRESILRYPLRYDSCQCPRRVVEQ